MTNRDKKEQKEPKILICKLCDFTTSKKNNYNRHILTQKHKKVVNSDIIVTNSDEKEQKEPIYIFECDCGKKYKYRQGLSYHKKNCGLLNNTTLIPIENKKEILELKEDNKELKNMIKELIKENAKHQQQIGDLIPRIGNNNTNIQNNNFSIKVFLDEKCKDAINMTDFVNSIKVSLEQLDYTKRHGLADGLSKTIMENMNRLTIYERPLHCTDVKRETLYIKDDDKWSKDDSRERMKRAIKGVTNANYRALKVWQGVHPDFRKDDRLTDYFTDTIVTLGKSLDGIDDKVVKTICRSTYLKLADIDT